MFVKKKLIVVWLLSLLLLFPTTVQAAEAPPIPYTVQKGDTLWRIARKYHLWVADIIGQSHLKSATRIYPGQKLLIPQVDPKVASFEKRVVLLTNQARKAQGLQPLTYNWELTRMARHKSEDMRDRHYFSHQSPTYGSPFVMMKSYGIAFRSAGENIAAGQPTPEAVVKAWLNSPGHRANIMNPSFRQIGCGVAFGGYYSVYWSQEFVLR